MDAVSYWFDMTTDVFFLPKEVPIMAERSVSGVHSSSSLAPNQIRIGRLLTNKAENIKIT